jgi:hypothetical protein
MAGTTKQQTTKESRLLNFINNGFASNIRFEVVNQKNLGQKKQG